MQENIALSLIRNAALHDGSPFYSELDLSRLRENRKENPMIVIACATRAGTTFLSNAIAEIAGLKWFRLSSSYFNVENDLYLPALLMADNMPCISVLHMRATYPSCAWINAFGIKTIINVRNIFTSVTSIANYFRCRHKHPDFESGYSSPSMVWVDINQHELTDDELMDMMIELFIPWYIHFYVSWYTVTERDEVKALWISYEEIKANTDLIVQKVLDFCDITALEGKGQSHWANIYAQYPPNDEVYQDNKAARPREYWHDKLTTARINKIKKFASYYPKVDFSRIGM